MGWNHNYFNNSEIMSKKAAEATQHLGKKTGDLTYTIMCNDKGQKRDNGLPHRGTGMAQLLKKVLPCLYKSL